MAKNVTIAGASYTDVPAVNLPQTGGGTATFTDVSGTTAQAADVAQGKQFFDALGVLTQGTASGGGGASNCVSGTFKGTTTGSVLEIDIPYTGNGWPIGFMIFPSAGVRNPGSVFNDAVQRYACQLFCVGKSRADRSQTTAETESDNKAYSHGVNRYKSSSTYNTQYAVTAIENYPTFWDAAANSNVSGIARMRTATKLSVFIASSSYGFMANVEYTYVIVYSS